MMRKPPMWNSSIETVYRQPILLGAIVHAGDLIKADLNWP